MSKEQDIADVKSVIWHKLPGVETVYASDSILSLGAVCNALDLDLDENAKNRHVTTHDIQLTHITVRGRENIDKLEALGATIFDPEQQKGTRQL